ncbi:hypothetical protein [Pseudomonas pseudonitroreducens]|uniref:hypothetical protein n=1 Tax=Pseudomonas pseudonitroreducens TaxID=2892326 RepID=UPI001F1D464C|nr:hypothetical protein [Pseudomonas pseudonitroreducens]
MSYLIVNIEHQVIMGVTEVPYTSFTNSFVAATDAEIARYERMQSILPDDHFVELSDVIKPSGNASAEQTQSKATPATLAAVKSLFRK